MAEVLAAVVTAAQAAEYCLKLCGLFDRLYHATATLREYQERILELTPLLRKIRQEPSLDTPEITSCTRSIAAILEPLTFLNKRRRTRFLDSITFVLKQKHFSRVFDSIGEKKSTLALYISTVILNEVRIGLRASRHPDTRAMDYYQEEEREPIPGDGDEGGSGRGQGAESGGESDTTISIEGERAQNTEDSTTMSDQCCQSGAILHIPRQNLQHSSDPRFLSIQNSTTCQPSKNADDAESPAYQDNIMTGEGHMHNGYKVIVPVTDERMGELTKDAVFSGNIKEQTPGPNARDTMHNGVDFKNEGHPARHFAKFRGNVMKANGEMHNGDTIR
ncbi:hypothetical protein PG985_016151 [Apiospora marii]|uniref:Fungal N-terminal domain-containing protein n=1 Tax=Apiospora marii TaxID=335849 RepID=A0ABR1S3K0_9PEZI